MAFTTGFWVANLEGNVARMNACLLGWGPKADFPAAASYKGMLALATDEGGLIYYSDGTNWVSLGNLTTLAQTITGLKTFGSILLLPASDPTTDNEAARKKYVNDQDTAVLGSVAKITSGTYTGNNTVNRAIAHGLGRIPKIVLIYESASYFYFHRITIGLAAVAYVNAAANGNIAVTAPDATNFYVGNATNYPTSANDSAGSYYWVAIG